MRTEVSIMAFSGISQFCIKIKFVIFFWHQGTLSVDKIGSGNAESFDFGPPWPPARSLSLGERDGNNLLAPKGKKKELELI